MSAWKVILAALVIFVAGWVTGGVLRQVSGSGTSETAKRQAEDHPMMPWQVREEYVRYLNKELGLSADQNQKISLLISDSQQRIKDLFKEIDPRMRAELKKVRAAIDDVLDSNQRTRFEELRRHRSKSRADDWRRKQFGETQKSSGATCSSASSMCALETAGEAAP